MHLVALALLGCRAGETADEGAYFTGDWACAYQPWDWAQDPVQALLQADEDGAFDYDPPGDVVTRRVGAYDFETGDLAWDTSYVEGSYLVAGGLQGYGTIYDDGDIDLLYLSSSLDVLGVETWSRVRVERSGCTATSSAWEVEAGAELDVVPDVTPTVFETTIVADDRLEASFAFDNDGDPWSGTRVSTADLDVVSDYGADDGTATVHTTLHGDGTGQGSQFSTDGDYDQFIEVDYRLDGSRFIDSEVYEAGSETLTQRCAYELSYAGEGVGTCSFEQGGDTIECELTFDPDSCTLDCGSDGTYDCS